MIKVKEEKHCCLSNARTLTEKMSYERRRIYYGEREKNSWVWLCGTGNGTLLCVHYDYGCSVRRITSRYVHAVMVDRDPALHASWL